MKFQPSSPTVADGSHSAEAGFTRVPGTKIRENRGLERGRAKVFSCPGYKGVARSGHMPGNGPDACEKLGRMGDLESRGRASDPRLTASLPDRLGRRLPVDLAGVVVSHVLPQGFQEPVHVALVTQP